MLARHSSALRRVGVAAGLLGGAIVLGGCQEPSFGLFRGATVQGKDIFKLWVGMVIAGLVVAALVWGLIFWSVLRYRRRNDAMPKQFNEHILLEIIYTIIPIVIVAGIFYFTVVTENEVDAVSNKPYEIVHVLAYRWGWRFSYFNSDDKWQGVRIQTAAEPKLLALPATSAEYPQLVLPKGENVRIVLTSEDVIHGFYIPQFDFSRYAQPGVTNVFDFTPTNTGVFRGQCSEFCGLYHSEMLFSVRVMSSAKFTSWLSGQQSAQAGGTL